MNVDDVGLHLLSKDIVVFQPRFPDRT